MTFMWSGPKCHPTFLAVSPPDSGLARRLLLDTAESQRGPVLEGGPSAKPLPDFEALITSVPVI